MVFADFNSKFCIVKHPPYGYLGELQEMFPNIKLIHIIRDGRAVYSSKRDTSSLSGKSMSNNVLMSALDWRYKLIQIQRFSGKKINVLFENLVANTNYELDRVLDFLELSDNDRLLSGDQEDYFQNIGPKQKTIHANVQSKPKSEITTKWKKNLSKNEINLYNFIAKYFLLQHDYEVQNINTLKAFFSYVIALICLLIDKSYNILLLIFLSPTKLKLKIIRRYRLLK